MLSWRNSWIWKPFNLSLAVLACGLFTSLQGARAADEVDNDTLYYAVDKPFKSDGSKIDLRISLGADVTNPFVNVFGARLGALYIVNRFISVGAEGIYYYSDERGSQASLAETLKRHGYRTNVAAPEYAVVALVKATPLAGLTNLLSSSVVQTEISLLGRGGMISYGNVGRGMTLGTGAEINLRWQSGWGVLASALWDWDHPGEGSWQSRTGFWVGPTLRF